MANADRLDGINSTGFYRAGSKVADANRLDGLDSSAFVGKCRVGSVHGFVKVNGNVTIPTEFSTVGTSVAYNCAGSAPLVRKRVTGSYYVCFPNNPSRGGMGNAVRMSEGSDWDNFITWAFGMNSACPGGKAFLVDVRDNDGDLEDAPFFLVAL